ncbi:MAG: hypothetical protein KBH78_06105 [Candidatus Hydrogenedentes bacterium]|nr:hypothetical protein [Candidatus Hydrogenedentota bacterium]
MKWWVGLLVLALTIAARGDDLKEKLGAVTFGDGWKVVEPIAEYTADNLYDYIDGEAEFFLPYGFERLYAIRLGTAPDAPVTLTADVYVLGSTMDAWGVYRAIRRQDAQTMAVGMEGARTDTLGLFCQGRYFVRMLLSGGRRAEPGQFDAAAKAVAAVLPQADRPPELALLDTEGVDRNSAKYIAKSVLAYPFFPRGLVADAAWKVGDREQRGRIIVLTTRDDAEARSVFEDYAKWLTDDKGGSIARRSDAELAADDALYRGVLLRREGLLIFGVIQDGPPDDGAAMMDRLVGKYCELTSSPAPADRAPAP